MRRNVFSAALVSLTVLAGCKSAPQAKPLDQLTAQEAHGHMLFQARCSVCHYDRTSQALHGPPLFGVFRTKYLPSGAPANDERVTATIMQGRALMPAQPDINPQDLDDLLAYLHTL